MGSIIKKLIVLTIVFWAVTGLFTSSMSMNLVYLTEHYPPHSYIEEGRLTGAAVEVLALMWQRLGIDHDVSQIKTVPWARGMKRIKSEPNIVLFGMGYSPERMEFLNWVGPYYSHSLYLIGKKGQDYKIRTLDDAARYRVGAVREDMGHGILKKEKFPMSSVELSNTLKSLLKKLKADRLDLVCYMGPVAFGAMPAYGLDPENYVRVFEVFKFKSGFGFSKGVPKETINAFQNTLDALVKEGEIRQILEKYDLR